MKYTLITSCLNSINTIERTINSVILQQILPLQYIFVDGGSEDGTIDLIISKKNIMESLGIKTLIIHQKTKGGIYESWNLALKQIDIKSDYIFILNSDDWYYNYTIQYVSDVFKKNKIDILCGASLDYSNKKTSISYNKKLIFFPFLMPIIHPACFIKKSVYNKLMLFNPKYRVSGDYDFLYRAYKNKFKFKFSKKILVNRLMGGYADSNKNKARHETYRIGCEHSKFIFLPLLSYILRYLLKR
tara:strand:- start:194 stop:925 length:732 start_codon:yes stop_codon:yes gene_type:complete